MSHERIHPAYENTFAPNSRADSLHRNELIAEDVTEHEEVEQKDDFPKKGVALTENTIVYEQAEALEFQKPALTPLPTGLATVSYDPYDVADISKGSTKVPYRESR